MNLKKPFYVWKCSHCDHRNKEVFNFHYEFPHRYNAVWECNSCGSESYIIFGFRVLPITDKKKENYYERW